MTRPPDPAAFLDATPLVPVEMGIDERVRYVGARALALLGYAADRWYDEGFWSDAVVPDDQATLASARRNTIQARGRHEVDYRMERSDGRVLWIAEILEYGGGPDGPVLRGFLWDISGRKRQEVALWKSEERIRGLLRKAPDAMVLTDAEGAVLNMNDQAEALFDYSLGEIVGSSIEHLLPEPLRPRLAELREAFERDPHRRSLVEGNAFAVQRSDGSEIPVEISLSRVSGEDEEGRILWSARDLTVRRRLEAQRRTGGDRGAPAPPTGRDEAAALPSPMALGVGGDGRVVDADAAVAAWVGASAGEVVGRAPEEVLGRDLFARLRAAIAAASAGSSGRLRWYGEGPAACLGAAEIAVVPRRTKSGAADGYSIVILPT